MSNPRVYKIRNRAKLTRRLYGPVSRSTAFLILFFILLATALYSGSSASSFHLRSRRPESVARGEDKSVKGSTNASKEVSKQLHAGAAAPISNLSTGMLLPLPQTAPTPTQPEVVTTYAADCTTPKSDFNYGDTVCAKIDGGYPISVSPRRFSWVRTDNVIQQLTPVTALGQTDTFQIPARDPDVDYRGVWTVNSISSRASVRASAVFTVSDPAAPTANLVIYDNLNTDASNVDAGSNIEFTLWIVNRGPDNASNVQVTDSIPADAAFVRAEQDSGPPFNCTPTSPGGTTATCTIASLQARTAAAIRVTFQTNAGATAGTVITNTATISSGTTEQNNDDNTASAQLAITSAGGTFCSLTCPDNIVKVADAMQGTDAGAYVTFSSASTDGDCGTVTASPASGSFFPVGDTTVTVSSGSGETCSFLVRVTDAAPPTISCQADVPKDAGDGCTATVTAAELGTPTTTGSGVSVEGVRDDGANLDDPYPIGTTTITWTATDVIYRTATCHQKVIVTGHDTTPPTITAPPDISDNTGTAGAACGKIIGETELGTPTASDNCSVKVTRTGVPAGNFFPVGTTTITYTATDGSGNTATAVQHVTITENTPPIIFAPPDASYTCPSEVPAADPSQARGPDIIDANGDPHPGPPSDNCGTPTVTVTESRSGAGSASSPLIITRTFTATDSSHNSASAVQTITVIDSTPPTISLNGSSSMTVECHTTFTDPGATASDNCGTATVTTGGNLNMNAPGTYTVTYTATDAAGNSSNTITRTVVVSDTTPPTITLKNVTIKLWPPNHKYQTISVSDLVASASDGCDGGVDINDVYISQVTSDEVENGNGDGNTMNDMVIAGDCKSVQLRSEREGNSNGRVYTITFKVKDASGNATTVTAKVYVPLNSGGSAVDDGVHYSVTSSCP